MIPLAQINFRECPPLEGFPTSGYLQFYIAKDETDLFGLNFDDQEAQTGFRVLYFREEEVIHPRQDFSFLNEKTDIEHTPVSFPHRLHFSLQEEYFAREDHQSIKLMAPIFSAISEKYPGIEDKLEDWAFDHTETGSRLGGYAYFTQYDPREEDSKSILLFQMGSHSLNIMWGDAGVGNFFIRPEDLARLDFTRVMYNWDCG